MKVPYIHIEAVHNLSAPREIVPYMMKWFNPASVVDIGCGLGTFLNVFKEHGVKEVLGLDGPWVDRTLLSKYLEESEFMECNLEKPISMSKKYDLAISLEVAEHLSPASSDIFVSNLVSAGHLILFSAAIPYQGGQNHLNEQWPSYWEEKFAKHNYIFRDVIRPVFWNNPEVNWWYKQNMVLITPNDFSQLPQISENPLHPVIHPESYMEKMQAFYALSSGKSTPIHYAKLLMKSILKRG